MKHCSQKYAPAKYNKAISQIKAGWYQEAYKSLSDLKADDLEIRETMDEARAESELDRLCEDDQLREKMRDFFEARKSW